jgi:signal transduction protein with GAF and PtsI domain
MSHPVVNINRFKRQLEYRNRLMEKISEIHSADNLNTILLFIKDSIAELMNAQRITIYLADAKRNILFSRVLSGKEIKQIVVPISDTSLAGFCALSGNVLSLKDAYDEHELLQISSNL